MSSLPKTAVEIISDKLYFACGVQTTPVDGPDRHFFSIDQVLRYEPFFNDFGPLNLGHTYRFCKMLRQKLMSAKNKNRSICYYCGTKPQFRSNAACLIGAYQIIYMGRKPHEAYENLREFEPYLPFRDAAQGGCSFKLTVLHCLRALYKAFKYKWFDFSTFNVEEYEYFECVENGDLNIIIPDVFLACSGPHRTTVDEQGYTTFTPDDYAPIFNKYGVKSVVRLNKSMYDRQDFLDSGFNHYDLFYIDGTTPSREILYSFIEITEKEQQTGMLAVHCKAGLGRTGTCMGAYMMKHYMITAAECIGWMRLVRPGSVIGPQQQFLQNMQDVMRGLGSTMRKKTGEGKELKLEDTDFYLDDDDGSKSENKRQVAPTTPQKNKRGSKTALAQRSSAVTPESNNSKHKTPPVSPNRKSKSGSKSKRRTKAVGVSLSLAAC